MGQAACCSCGERQSDEVTGLTPRRIAPAPRMPITQQADMQPALQEVINRRSAAEECQDDTSDSHAVATVAIDMCPTFRSDPTAAVDVCLEIGQDAIESSENLNKEAKGDLDVRSDDPSLCEASGDHDDYPNVRSHVDDDNVDKDLQKDMPTPDDEDKRTEAREDLELEGAELLCVGDGPNSEKADDDHDGDAPQTHVDKSKIENGLQHDTQLSNDEKDGRQDGRQDRRKEEADTDLDADRAAAKPLTGTFSTSEKHEVPTQLSTPLAASMSSMSSSGVRHAASMSSMSSSGAHQIVEKAVFKEENQCARCSRALGKLKFRPRHHCRMCGDTVCADCSKNQVLVKLSSDPDKKMQPQRACDRCAAMGLPEFPEHAQSIEQ